MTDAVTPPTEVPLTLRTWIGLFADLDRAGVPSAAALRGIATEDVRFCDPFNDLRGIEHLRRLLTHTRQQLPGARFEVLDTAWSDPRAYLRWRMTAQVRVLGDWRVEGMSEVRFAPDGRVVARAAQCTDEILLADVDMGDVSRSHARRLFLKHRRPELYADWLGR